MIDPIDQIEFIGQVIDIFEDYLAKNDKSKSRIHIQGKDYKQISEDLKAMMEHWGVFTGKEEYLEKD